MHLSAQVISAIFALNIIACSANEQPVVVQQKSTTDLSASIPVYKNDSIRAIHVLVALCDNKYQGIVPVPASIGNGQDPSSNLYWGAGYGIKSFFNKSKDWQLVSKQANPATAILERILFKHRSRNIYLLADAYDGRFIKETTTDFLSVLAGIKQTTIQTEGKTIHFGAASDLVAYIGHDGLMDFSVLQKFEGDSTNKKEAIILACYSKNYFANHLRYTKASPLLWTTGLMAPEAYTLHDAIAAWADKKTPEQIRNAAANAYAKYQRCSFKAAQRLLVAGW